MPQCRGCLGRARLGGGIVDDTSTCGGDHDHAIRARYAALALQASAARGLTRFVGRDGDLDQLCQALEQAGTGQGQVVALMGELLTLDETLKPMLPAMLALLDVPVEDAQWQVLDPPHRRRQTLEAVKRLLICESHVQPLLLIFEDLHWLDSETQALPDSLVESLPTAPVPLLVNYRPEYQHGWGSQTYDSQLRLDPLPDARADELL